MKTAEEMINFSKKYTPIVNDEVIASFEKIEEKLKGANVIFAFVSAFVVDTSSYSLTNVGIAVTDSNIFLCGRTNNVLSSHTVIKLNTAKISSMEIANTNSGTYSNLLLNKNIRISMSSNEQAIDISKELKNILNIDCSYKQITQAKKNDKSDNIGYTILNVGKIISYISLIGILGLYISPFIAVISTLAIYIAGLCLSGLGKIVMNTDELVRIAKESKESR